MYMSCTNVYVQFLHKNIHTYKNIEILYRNMNKLHRSILHILQLPRISQVLHVAQVFQLRHISQLLQLRHILHLLHLRHRLQLLQGVWEFIVNLDMLWVAKICEYAF